jgi:hypothetical protein
LRQRHASGDAECEGRHGKRKGRVQANPGNQDEQQQDGSRGAGEQEPAGRDGKRDGMHGRIIPYATATLDLPMCSSAHFEHLRVCYHKDDHNPRNLTVDAPARAPD